MLGCFLVYFTLIKDRDRNLMGWLPNEQILQKLKNTELVINGKNECLQCLGIDSVFFEYLFEEGDVIISESSPRAEPKIYVLEVEGVAGNTYKLTFALSEVKSELIAIKTENEQQQQCNCD
ncbi:MAG: hypothetical protein COA57_09575 [Flavobacteriales bacterium]|nr:MAG: hypothetical protein COA57_09575 [Flavobacteriales bacterium]